MFVSKLGHFQLFSLFDCNSRILPTMQILLSIRFPSGSFILFSLAYIFFFFFARHYNILRSSYSREKNLFLPSTIYWTSDSPTITVPFNNISFREIFSEPCWSGSNPTRTVFKFSLHYGFWHFSTTGVSLFFFEFISFYPPPCAEFISQFLIFRYARPDELYIAKVKLKFLLFNYVSYFPMVLRRLCVF